MYILTKQKILNSEKEKNNSSNYLKSFKEITGKKVRSIQLFELQRVNRSLEMVKPRAYLSNDSSKIVITKTSYEDRHLLKNIGATWNSRSYCWGMPISKIALKACVDAGFEVDALLFSFVGYNQDDVKKFSDKIHKKENFKTQPYKHQEKLVDLFLSERKVFFLCEVGTGKTKAAIDSAIAIGAKKILVVTPACVMDNFEKEVKVHSDYDAVVLRGSVSHRKKLLAANHHHCYIVNYDVLNKLEKELIDSKFDIVIFDEVHFLKSAQSKRSKSAYKIAQNIQNRIGLTGTLIANGLQDAFGPYKVIDSSYFGANYNVFKSRYLLMGGYDAGFGGTQVIGYQNQLEFKKIISKNSLKFGIDDVTDLPEKIEMPLYFELDVESKKVYKNVIKEQETEYTPTSAIDKTMKIQRVTSGKLFDHFESNEKINLLLNQLEGLSNEKVVIWCRFTDTLRFISNALNKIGIPSITYDGANNDKNVVFDFNNATVTNGLPYVMLAQVQMGVGWEIPSSKYAIFYEMDYSRINYVQAKGRNRRLKGSDSGSVVYMYLLAKGTIDEAIYKTLQSKDFTAKEALEYVEGY